MSNLTKLFVLLVVIALLGLVTWPSQPAQGESYGWLNVETVVVQSTGTPGQVSGSQVTGNPVIGHVQAIHLDFPATISNTTDITLTQGSPPLTVLQLSDTYTDTWYYPAAEQTGSDGSGLSVYDRLLMADYLTVTAGQATSGTIVTATIYWGE